MSTKELKNIAKERKLQNYHNLSKEDLSRMLKIPIFLTKRYYQNIAKDRNLKNYHNLNKADLVKLLNMNPEIPIPAPRTKKSVLPEKPIPAPRTKKSVLPEKPIPAPRRKPEKPIPAPRRNIPQQSKKRLTRCLAGWIGSVKVVKRLPSQFHPP